MRRGVRRPLVALVVLVLALVVGYAVKAWDSDSGPTRPSRSPSQSLLAPVLRDLPDRPAGLADPSPGVSHT
ncbi:MAG: hypothetical protein ABI345_12870 [Jatrophihabitans sp.]